jgi:ketosteroid isomerase-like protein
MSQAKSAVERWHHWAALWNGNLALAGDLIADGFVAHLSADAPGSPEELRDARAVAQWVKVIRDRVEGLAYTTEVGPFGDGDLVAGHWRASARKKGADGKMQPYEKIGTDILRVRDGKIVEVWTLNADPRRR